MISCGNQAKSVPAFAVAATLLCPLALSSGPQEPSPTRLSFENGGGSGVLGYGSR